MPSLTAIRVGASGQYISLQSPTIVVCGGTNGIGAAIVKRLTQLSERPIVHVVGRNQDAASQIINELKQAKPTGQYNFHKCDLTLVKDTSKLCDDLKSRINKIDILVASQGILSVAGRTETIEGHDQKMMLHYYSRVATINALQDKLATGARVMSVLDASRGDTKQLILDDLELKRNFSIKKAADHCLAMSDVALQHLAKQRTDVAYFHAYPGFVQTSLGSQSLPWYARTAMKPISALFGVSASDCAEHLCHALLLRDASAYKCGGAYFCDNKGDPVKGKEVPEPEMVEKVWSHTTNLLSAV